MSKQNELREALKKLTCFDCLPRLKKPFKGCICSIIISAEIQILALFREKARQTAHEAVPEKEGNSLGEWGWNKAITKTHKNIDAKFDAWGK